MGGPLRFYPAVPGVPGDLASESEPYIKEVRKMVFSSEEFTQMPLHWQIVFLLRLWYDGEGDGKTGER